MLRRLGTLSLALVLTALPSLSRICLTGCDVERLAATRPDRPRGAMAAQTERGPERDCPLHDNQSLPAQPARPDPPSAPLPCQHQPELASTDYAKSRSLVSVTDSPCTRIFTAAIVTDSMCAAVDAR